VMVSLHVTDTHLWLGCWNNLPQLPSLGNHPVTGRTLGVQSQVQHLHE